jgi:hypothetical protein
MSQTATLDYKADAATINIGYSRTLFFTTFQDHVLDAPAALC